MSRAGDLGIGISQFVSVGNKADVSGNDLLQYWADDAQTEVILLYLESFGNPAKFVRLARNLARSKPIVAVKSGRTAAGSRAASSHTAALAAPDVAVDALFRQAGVIRVDTLEELLSTAMVLAHQPLPAGRRVAIVTNAGGPGILAADACGGAGLQVPELDAATQAALRAIASAGASVRNPVDLVAGATAEQFEDALRIALSDASVDAVLAIFVPPLVTRAEDVARAIVRAADSANGKPIVSCFLGQAGVPDALRGTGERRTIPSFAFPESAAHALGRVADLADWRRRPPGSVPDLPGLDVARARSVVAAALESQPEGSWLDPAAAASVLSCFGIPTVATREVTDVGQARRAARELGFPVALKASAPALVHKSDVGGVALDLHDESSVAAAFTAMSRSVGPAMTGAVVQPMVAAGVELIVGITHDPTFGPLVLFGLGGVTAELLADRALRLVPVTDEDAHQLVRSLRGSQLLFGYRGRPAANVAALEDLLLRVGALADQAPGDRRDGSESRRRLGRGSRRDRREDARRTLAAPGSGGHAPDANLTVGARGIELADGPHERRERFAEVGQERPAREAQGAVVEHRVRRARRRPGRIEIGGRDRLDARGIVAGGAQHLARELEPADRALVRHVPRAGQALDDEAAQHEREVGGDRGATALVVDEPQRGVARREPQHRLRHVRAVAPDDPRGAHDRALEVDLELATQLRLPVHRRRIRRVPLVVRLGLRAVEDVVGRERDDVRAGAPRPFHDESDPERVHEKRAIGLRLARVDRGHRRAVHDRVGLDRADRAEHGIAVADVERRVVEADDLVRLQRFDDFAADHAARAGDENAQRSGHFHAAVSSTGARSNSGSHQSRFAAYHSTVSRSPVSKPTCGSQPSSARIFAASSR